MSNSATVRSPRLFHRLVLRPTSNCAPFCRLKSACVDDETHELGNRLRRAAVARIHVGVGRQRVDDAQATRDRRIGLVEERLSRAKDSRSTSMLS